MTTLFKTFASSTGLVQGLLHLATWLLAHALQMPEPMVHAAAFFLVLRAQTIENGVGKNLCPIALARRLMSRWREAL